MEDSDLQKYHSEYEALKSSLEDFCKQVCEQLNKLFWQAQIDLGFPIQTRVKRWPSILEKLNRVSLHLKSILEMQDLAGLRINLLFRKDVSRVCNILEKNFKVVKKYDTFERLREDQFGYSSVHYIIKLSEDWLSVPTLKGFELLQVEVQIRTLAQHIWAEASQILQYKRESSVPPGVLRSVYRVSALLETVDLELDRVLSEKSYYRENVIDLNKDDVLNVDLLENILDKYLPKENKGEKKDEDFSALVEEFSFFGIKKTSDLIKLIESHINDALLEEQKAVAIGLGKQTSLTRKYKFDQSRIKEGKFFLFSGLVREMLRKRFGKKYEDFQKSKSASKKE